MMFMKEFAKNNDDKYDSVTETLCAGKPRFVITKIMYIANGKSPLYTRPKILQDKFCVASLTSYIDSHKRRQVVVAPDIP